MYCYSLCPQACSRPPLTHTFARDSQTPTGKYGTVSCGVTVPFSWVLVHKVLLCPQRVYFPVLCKFWQLSGGINGDLLQEDLCHTHTQNPCPCSSPLLTCTSAVDTQTQFCLSLCGVSGSWCTKDLFEPSECLWQVWGLIQNMILTLLPSYWGFSFALEYGVFSSKSFQCFTAAAPAPTVLLGFSALGHRLSPHSCSSTMQLLLQHSAAVHLSKQSIDWTLKLKTKIIKENVNFYCTLNTKELTHSCVCFFFCCVFPMNVPVQVMNNLAEI